LVSKTVGVSRTTGGRSRRPNRGQPSAKRAINTAKSAGDFGGEIKESTVI
jgi:hypothetical protein